MTGTEIEIGTGTFDDPIRDPRDTGETRESIMWLRCCKLDCDKTGETDTIYDIITVDSPERYDYTQGCIDHIGHLLGTVVPEDFEPTQWTIFTIQPAGEPARTL